MTLTSRFDDAFAFARDLHEGHLRKGSEIPYVSHLMSVAAIVLEHGGTEDEATAALLHDAIEDQGGDPTRQLIRRRFGDTVDAIVDGCTDADTLPKPPWRERKERHIDHLSTASDSVRLVSAADKLHNARALLGDYRCIGDSLWSRFNAEAEDILWYYRSLVVAFQKNGATRLTCELERTVGELGRLAGIPAAATGDR